MEPALTASFDRQQQQQQRRAIKCFQSTKLTRETPIAIKTHTPIPEMAKMSTSQKPNDDVLPDSFAYLQGMCVCVCVDCKL